MKKQESLERQQCHPRMYLHAVTDNSKQDNMQNIYTENLQQRNKIYKHKSFNKLTIKEKVMFFINEDENKKMCEIKLKAGVVIGKIVSTNEGKVEIQQPNKHTTIYVNIRDIQELIIIGI
ncbi:CotO family spore coat protein [Sutcliffiella cohnii]